MATNTATRYCKDQLKAKQTPPQLQYHDTDSGQRCYSVYKSGDYLRQFFIHSKSDKSSRTESTLHRRKPLDSVVITTNTRSRSIVQLLLSINSEKRHGWPSASPAPHMPCPMRSTYNNTSLLDRDDLQHMQALCSLLIVPRELSVTPGCREEKGRVQK